MSRLRPTVRDFASLKLIAAYGAGMAAIVWLLDWLDYRRSIHDRSGELYVLAVAVIFALLGGWLALRLIPRPATGTFVANEAALRQLRISAREREVLALLAKGATNKGIARTLEISPNTVKTHVASLYAKLEASNRTQAVAQARALSILP